MQSTTRNVALGATVFILAQVGTFLALRKGAASPRFDDRALVGDVLIATGVGMFVASSALLNTSWWSDVVPRQV